MAPPAQAPAAAPAQAPAQPGALNPVTGLPYAQY